MQSRVTADFTPYPITFVPQLQERVWGGDGLRRYGRNVAESGAPIGESWELSDVDEQLSRVASGAYEGTRLRDLLERFPTKLLGAAARAPDGAFPLLVKLLDARQNLSVQVHPSDDDLARQGLVAAGKTEAWIILDAEPGSQIVHGVAAQGELFETLKRRGQRLTSAEEQQLFRWIDVARGDVVFVPAGTIHALGRGITLLEVQQTCDTTYRIYDWGRVGLDGAPRALHLEQAESVSSFEVVECPWSRIPAVAAGEPGGAVRPLLECQYFSIELVDLAADAAEVPLTTTPRDATSTCHILIGYGGGAEIVAPSSGAMSLRQGDVALLPAALGDYQLQRSGTAVDAQVLRVTPAHA